jgi:hypothetical protein
MYKDFLKVAHGFQLQKCNDLEDYIFCMQWDHVPLKFLFQFARLRTPNSNESTSTSALYPKLYIPSSINIWKKLLRTAIWEHKKW